MNIEQITEMEGFASMSPLEISWYLELDACRPSFAKGIAWGMLMYAHDEIDEIILWAERADLNVIFNGDDPVGFSDRCPEKPERTT